MKNLFKRLFLVDFISIFNPHRFQTSQTRHSNQFRHHLPIATRTVYKRQRQQSFVVFAGFRRLKKTQKENPLKNTMNPTKTRQNINYQKKNWQFIHGSNLVDICNQKTNINPNQKITKKNK